MEFINALRAFIASTALVLLSTSVLPAAELVIPDNVIFERGIEYSNPDPRM
jgi:hypothetical protein